MEGNGRKEGDEKSGKRGVRLSIWKRGKIETLRGGNGKRTKERINYRYGPSKRSKKKKKPSEVE